MPTDRRDPRPSPGAEQPREEPRESLGEFFARACEELAARLGMDCQATRREGANSR